MAREAVPVSKDEKDEKEQREADIQQFYGEYRLNLIDTISKLTGFAVKNQLDEDAIDNLVWFVLNCLGSAMNIGHCLSMNDPDQEMMYISCYNSLTHMQHRYLDQEDWDY